MKIAVITGASSGIGRELVYAVDREYEFDEIWVIARRLERLEELKGVCRNKIRPVALDLCDEASYVFLENMLSAEKPEIRLLVNAAGCGHFGPFKEQTLAPQISSVKLNSIALTAICHIALQHMNAGSSIINLGSNSSWQPVPNMAVYGASKSYVLNFSRALGRELESQNIKVLCVCPGWIKTEFQENAEHDKYVKYVDRWYMPDEVAAQALSDLKAGKTVSILGSDVRRQVKLVKFAPVNFVMNVWCRQQGIE